MTLSPRWADVLIEAGFQAIHWSMIGMGDERDSTIMAYAAGEDAIVLTHDLDFGAILAATGGRAPSVVQSAPTTPTPPSPRHQSSEPFARLTPNSKRGLWSQSIPTAPAYGCYR